MDKQVVPINRHTEIRRLHEK